MTVGEFRNYTDDELKHLQDLELMILKDVVKLFDKHNIKYYMYGGTLLGTIRHKGFIPWDDDIDIILFRDDYDKALEVINDELSDKYSVVQMDYIEDCFSSMAVISLKGTTFGRWYSKYVSHEIGIHIDLFPLDNIPNNYTLGKIQYYLYRFAYQFVINSIIKMDMYTKLMTKLHHMVYHILNFLPINPRTWKKMLTKTMTFYNKKETEKVVDWFNLCGFMPYERNYFEPALKAQFEDFEVRIPNKYDELLTQIYGDYMKIPPEEDRYNAAPDVLDFGKY